MAEMADREDVHLVDTISDESIQQEHMEPETECEENLQSWLGKIALEGHLNKMKECGLTSVSHLEDIHTEDDAVQNFGMTTFQARRLLREFNEWKTKKNQLLKKGKGQQPLLSVPGFRTNNNSVVVSLPPAFQGFLGTRDGGKSVIVSTSHLAKKWSNVYYKTPQNPVQILSNQFMLRMCESQQYKFKSRRECETWARKEREKRISLLLALEKNTKGWTPYYKKKSIYGIVSNLQERFPAVAVLTEDNVKKADYESCVEFKDSLESLCHTIIGHEETVEMSIQDAIGPTGNVKTGRAVITPYVCVCVWWGVYTFWQFWLYFIQTVLLHTQCSQSPLYKSLWKFLEFHIANPV